ncbi:MAG: hypothetical protein NT001_04070 [Candidatus Woesearchaeota archaeon]|nr:hypothetical protein [Candidatus Woesearchaeota archaeon]
MVEKVKTTICGGCKKSVPMYEIKYMPKGYEGSVPLCRQCVLDEEAKKQKTKERKEKASLMPKKTIRFVCERCRYKFDYDPKGRKARRCPSCGKDDKIEEDKFSMSSVLETV